ncbi:TIGR04283 family arsenosugar biosynthesis glycosyltransferase [Gemella cuniculi]|uniref:TIGR04283 family arsenosugar biosynthesis glycosyltransferase n=1 Tax=Gemella cuniculi TaxID=150240 RepID=UPI0003F615B0|nr:TIGR04283 family arsenosugar biosynthesis glycosyltransferase [Gemella cuniculi]
MISIIIPIYNEEKNIRDFIYNLYCLHEIKNHEILFIDGGSTDKTLAILEELSYFGYSYYTSDKKGRANQMNYGAKISHGNILWFVHADSILQKNVIKKIISCSSPVGCLKIKFYPNSLSMRINSLVSNMRASITNIAFGDQGLFMKKEIFEEIGGYTDIPIMEDYKISEDLTAHNYKITVIDSTITTSTRRYKGKVYKTMYQMQKFQKMYRKGVSVQEISKLYKDIR